MSERNQNEQQNQNLESKKMKEEYRDLYSNVNNWINKGARMRNELELERTQARELVLNLTKLLNEKYPDKYNLLKQYFKDELKEDGSIDKYIGRKGIAVIQATLNALGVKGMNGKELSVDGVLGKQTLSAIMYFQKSNDNYKNFKVSAKDKGGKVDGVVGPRMLSSIVISMGGTIDTKKEKSSEEKPVQENQSVELDKMKQQYETDSNKVNSLNESIEQLDNQIEEKVLSGEDLTPLYEKKHELEEQRALLEKGLNDLGKKIFELEKDRMNAQKTQIEQKIDEVTESIEDNLLNGKDIEELYKEKYKLQEELEKIKQEEKKYSGGDTQGENLSQNTNTGELVDGQSKDQGNLAGQPDEQSKEGVKKEESGIGAKEVAMGALAALALAISKLGKDGTKIEKGADGKVGVKTQDGKEIRVNPEDLKGKEKIVIGGEELEVEYKGPEGKKPGSLELTRKGTDGKDQTVSIPVVEKPKVEIGGKQMEASAEKTADGGMKVEIGGVEIGIKKGELNKPKVIRDGKLGRKVEIKMNKESTKVEIKVEGEKGEKNKVYEIPVKGEEVRIDGTQSVEVEGKKVDLLKSHGEKGESKMPLQGTHGTPEKEGAKEGEEKGIGAKEIAMGALAALALAISKLGKEGAKVEKGEDGKVGVKTQDGQEIRVNPEDLKGKEKIVIGGEELEVEYKGPEGKKPGSLELTKKGADGKDQTVAIPVEEKPKVEIGGKEVEASAEKTADGGMKVEIGGVEIGIKKGELNKPKVVRDGRLGRKVEIKMNKESTKVEIKVEGEKGEPTKVYEIPVKGEEVKIDGTQSVELEGKKVYLSKAHGEKGESKMPLQGTHGTPEKEGAKEEESGLGAKEVAMGALAALALAITKMGKEGAKVEKGEDGKIGVKTQDGKEIRVNPEDLRGGIDTKVGGEEARVEYKKGEGDKAGSIEVKTKGTDGKDQTVSIPVVEKPKVEIGGKQLEASAEKTVDGGLKVEIGGVEIGIKKGELNKPKVVRDGRLGRKVEIKMGKEGKSVEIKVEGEKGEPTKVYEIPVKGEEVKIDGTQPVEVEGKKVDLSKAHGEKSESKMPLQGTHGKPEKEGAKEEESGLGVKEVAMGALAALALAITKMGKEGAKVEKGEDGKIGVKTQDGKEIRVNPEDLRGGIDTKVGGEEARVEYKKGEGDKAGSIEVTTKGTDGKEQTVSIPVVEKLPSSKAEIAGKQVEIKAFPINEGGIKLDIGGDSINITDDDLLAGKKFQVRVGDETKKVEVGINSESNGIEMKVEGKVSGTFNNYTVPFALRQQEELSKLQSRLNDLKAKRKAEQEARIKAEQEAAEAKRLAEIEAARIRAEQERIRAEQEAARIKAENLKNNGIEYEKISLKDKNLTSSDLDRLFYLKKTIHFADPYLSDDSKSIYASIGGVGNEKQAKESLLNYLNKIDDISNRRLYIETIFEMYTYIGDKSSMQKLFARFDYMKGIKKSCIDQILEGKMKKDEFIKYVSFLNPSKTLSPSDVIQIEKIYANIDTKDKKLVYESLLTLIDIK